MTFKDIIVTVLKKCEKESNPGFPHGTAARYQPSDTERHDK
jgi:hypothetical protein